MLLILDVNPVFMESCSMSDYENVCESSHFNKYHKKLYDFQGELCEESDIFGKAFYL